VTKASANTTPSLPLNRRPTLLAAGSLLIALLAVYVADFATIPAWIVGGALLWRRQALGYVCGAGLLFGASMLFVGLLVYFLVQPALTGAPFATSDFVAILFFSLICFVPFDMFLRGLRGV
jgi:hypothetical protein